MESLNEESSRLFSSALADSTWKSYERARSILRSFQTLYGFETSWPVPVNQLVQFIAYLSLKKFAPATIRSYVSGISFSQKALNLNDTTKNFVIAKMLEGVTRDNPRKDTRAPITLPLLNRIVNVLPHVCSSTYEYILFKSAFILAFFAFLRVGEFTANKRRNVTSPSLQINDISLTNDQLKLFIRKSKTDQRGYSNCIVVNRYLENDVTCPVLSLKKYLEIRPSLPNCQQLFIHIDGSCLTRYQVSAVLRKAVSFLNIPDADKFKSHSFRIGACSEAKLRGISDDTIKKWGRWSSDAFTCYIRIPL